MKPDFNFSAWVLFRLSSCQKKIYNNKSIPQKDNCNYVPFQTQEDFVFNPEVVYLCEFTVLSSRSLQIEPHRLMGDETQGCK